jgi:hypothetical protein
MSEERLMIVAWTRGCSRRVNIRVSSADDSVVLEGAVVGSCSARRTSGASRMRRTELVFKTDSASSMGWWALDSSIEGTERVLMAAGVGADGVGLPIDVCDLKVPGAGPRMGMAPLDRAGTCGAVGGGGEDAMRPSTNANFLLCDSEARSSP